MIENPANEVLILPDRFLEADWNKIDSSLKVMLEDYLTNFEKYETKGLGPALFGSPGTGKTYAAAALSRKLVSKTVPVLWSSTVQDLNLLLDYRDYRSKNYFTLKNRLLTTRVVVFDDFGQLRDFERIRELFFEIVDYRYAWKCPTIFTANFSIVDEKGWDNVKECFNPALARRIRLMSQGLIYNAE